MTWQPIETAPKDGAWFLGYEGSRALQDRIDVWHWSENIFDYAGFVNSADSNEPWEQPTHWMPLPPAPTGDA